MMPSLARSIVIYEWKRFWAAVLALGFSAFLVFMQSGLALGSWFLAETAFLDTASADLWATGSGEVRSFTRRGGIHIKNEFDMLMHPEVEKVEALYWSSVRIKTNTDSSKRAWIIIVDPKNYALSVSENFMSKFGAKLEHPLSVVFDKSSAKLLQIKIGDFIELNNKRVRVVGFSDEYPGSKVSYVFCNDATFKYITPHKNPNWFGFLLVKVKDPAKKKQVRDELNSLNLSLKKPKFTMWTQADLYWRSLSYWMFEGEKSLVWLFLVGLALVVAAEITNASLKSAIQASLREYAALRALGVSKLSLSAVVFKQALIISIPGVILGLLLTYGFSIYTNYSDMAFYLPLWLIAPVSIIVVLTTLISGLLAVRTLYHTEPAELLR